MYKHEVTYYIHTLYHGTTHPLMSCMSCSMCVLVVVVVVV